MVFIVFSRDSWGFIPTFLGGYRNIGDDSQGSHGSFRKHDGYELLEPKMSAIGFPSYHQTFHVPKMEVLIYIRCI